MSVVCFILLTYGLCFLAADARIFGVDATRYVETLHTPGVPATDEEREQIRKMGIVPLRQQALKVRFVREHLSCYFCMGVWAGPLAHWISLQMTNFGSPWQMQDYFLNHPDTGIGWVYGLICAFLIGGAGSYIVNTIVAALEDRI